MTTISKERRDAAKALIREALRFAVWASGEGIGPDPLSDEADPDVMLMDYTTATSDEDWDTLAYRLPALLDALDAAEKAEPVAWEGYWPGAGSADSFTKLTRHKATADEWVSDGADVTPLYAHPPATREGWKLVPVEPTEDMIEAGHKQIDWCRNDQNTHRPGHPSQKPGGVGSDCGEDIRDAWAAMLAAATAGEVSRPPGPSAKITTTCDGCPLLHTEDWEFHEENNGIDRGVDATCGGASGRNIASYWHKGFPAPKWCPFPIKKAK